MAHLLLIRSSKVEAAFKTLGTLTLLLVALPFNLLVVGLSLLWTGITAPFQSPPKKTNTPKTIMLTGGKMTKSLQLARSFWQAGHRVVLVETHKYWLSGHRYSRAVAAFDTVPAPEKDPDGYCQGLLAIAQREKADVFIPVSSPVASYYDSLAGEVLKDYCEVIHFEPEITQMLDDKFTFCEKARELGLSAPESYLITDPQQILDFDWSNTNKQFLLKSIAYDSVSRLDMTQLPFDGMEAYVANLPISQDKPWTMQQFITGKEYCTHSTVRKGVITVYCCSESSPFQINYRQVENPQIYQWVKQFVGLLSLTGQISFDFLQGDDGTVYPIECNPRTHSAITMFHDHPALASAYLNDAEENQPPITPLLESKPTYWLYHELWRLTGIRSLADLQAWIDKIAHGTDAMFRVDDPLPFLMVHHWQIPLLLLQNLSKLKGWVKIDFNIGKLVEIGGD